MKYKYLWIIVLFSLIFISNSVYSNDINFDDVADVGIKIESFSYSEETNEFQAIVNLENHNINIFDHMEFLVVYVPDQINHDSKKLIKFISNKIDKFNKKHSGYFFETEKELCDPLGALLKVKKDFEQVKIYNTKHNITMNDSEIYDDIETKGYTTYLSKVYVDSELVESYVLEKEIKFNFKSNLILNSTGGVFYLFTYANYNDILQNMCNSAGKVSDYVSYYDQETFENVLDNGIINVNNDLVTYNSEYIYKEPNYQHSFRQVRFKNETNNITLDNINDNYYITEKEKNKALERFLSESPLLTNLTLELGEVDDSENIVKINTHIYGHNKDSLVRYFEIFVPDEHKYEFDSEFMQRQAAEILYDYNIASNLVNLNDPIERRNELIYFLLDDKIANFLMDVGDISDFSEIYTYDSNVLTNVKHTHQKGTYYLFISDYVDLEHDRYSLNAHIIEKRVRINHADLVEGRYSEKENINDLYFEENFINPEGQGTNWQKLKEYYGLDERNKYGYNNDFKGGMTSIDYAELFDSKTGETWFYIEDFGVDRDDAVGSSKDHPTVYKYLGIIYVDKKHMFVLENRQSSYDKIEIDFTDDITESETNCDLILSDDDKGLKLLDAHLDIMDDIGIDGSYMKGYIQTENIDEPIDVVVTILDGYVDLDVRGGYNLILEILSKELYARSSEIDFKRIKEEIQKVTLLSFDQINLYHTQIIPIQRNNSFEVDITEVINTNDVLGFITAVQYDDKGRANYAGLKKNYPEWLVKDHLKSEYIYEPIVSKYGYVILSKIFNTDETYYRRTESHMFEEPNYDASWAILTCTQKEETEESVDMNKDIEDLTITSIINNSYKYEEYRNDSVGNRLEVEYIKDNPLTQIKFKIENFEDNTILDNDYVYIYIDKESNNLMNDLEEQFYTRSTNDYIEVYGNMIAINNLPIKYKITSEDLKKNNNYIIIKDNAGIKNNIFVGVSKFKDGAGDVDKLDYAGNGCDLANGIDFLKEKNYELDYMFIHPYDFMPDTTYIETIKEKLKPRDCIVIEEKPIIENNLLTECPEGYIEVLGNQLYDTNNFCVMKYEAKKENNKPVSKPEEEAWSRISQKEAKEKCKTLGHNAHLITNNEWMTIARNLEQVPENWSSGKVGSGFIKMGNIGFDLDKVCYNGPNSDYVGTNVKLSQRDNNSLARLKLSNNKYIWDFSGNMWELINGTVDKSDLIFRNNNNWVEMTDTINYGSFGYDGLRPLNEFWDSEQGFGKIYITPGTIDQNIIFVRGGDFQSRNTAGIYSLYILNKSIDYTASSIGFRCVQNFSKDFCGNGIVEDWEGCDGNNLNGKTCNDLGYNSGTLSCNNDCTINSNCFNKPSSNNTQNQQENLSCPTGYIKVPGNQTYNLSDFCVAKYEMKKGSDGKPISQAAEEPWVEISRTEAISACESLGSKYHLITNDERMTIARNIELVTANWSTGVVGNGYIYSGHNDIDPFNALVASTDDSDGYYGTNNTSGNQRRTLSLDNGNIIWDFAGNVVQWCSDSIQAKDMPDGFDSNGIEYNDGYESDGTRYIVKYGWFDYNQNYIRSGSRYIDRRDLGNTTLAEKDLFMLGNYNTSNGVGKIFTVSDRSSTFITTKYFLFGGFWGSETNSGPLALTIDGTLWTRMSTIGFRCVVVP